MPLWRLIGSLGGSGFMRLFRHFAMGVWCLDFGMTDPDTLLIVYRLLLVYVAHGLALWDSVVECDTSLVI